MTTLAEARKRELTWCCPEKGRHGFTLRADGEQVGRLDFAAREGEPSTGEMNGRRWTFEYRNLWYPHITVRDDATGEIVATSEPSWKGGATIAFAAGSRFHWVKSNVWGTRWCFRREHDSASVCMALQSGSLKTGGHVSVCCGAAQLDEAPVLILLVWYLRVLAFEGLAEDIFVAG